MENTTNGKKIILSKIASALIQKEQTVFLFGAGASMPSGIPGTQSLKQSLFEENIKPIVDSFRKLAKQIHVNFSALKKGELHSINFEQLMTLACEYHGQEHVAKWIERYIPDVYTDELRYLPSIAYEFVAHLMANNLIRHVVNFNYDEVLDKTINHELGQEKCYRVVTMEDFERLSLMLNNGNNWDHIADYFNAKYFLIKPHGTRSMRRTFRYTTKDVFQFEKDKADVLKSVFKDSIMVMVGYGSEDLDFRNLLVKMEPYSIRNIIVVRNNPQTTINVLGGNKNVLGYRAHSDDFLRDLAETLYGNNSEFKDNYNKYYTKATRHFIRAEVNKLLSPTSTKPEDEISGKSERQKERVKINPLFFEELSLVIEILIYCFKVRGLFTRDGLMSCTRVISSLYEYLKKLEKLKILGKSGDIIFNPIERIIGDLRKEERGIIVYDDSRFDEIWCYMPKSIGSFERMAEKVCEDYLFPCYLNTFIQEKDRHPLKETLKACFSALPDDFDYDLAPSDISLFSLPLKNAERIISREGFRDKTDEVLVLANEEGNSLYILSTSVAEWFYKWGKSHFNTSNEDNIKLLFNKDVWDIVESLHSEHTQPVIKELRESFGADRIKCRRGVKYSLTLAFKEKADNRITGKAILFRRPGKASAFNPIYIQENDIEKNMSDIYKMKVHFEGLFNEGERF